MLRYVVLPLFLGLVLVQFQGVTAQDAGQADLDKATEVQLHAKTLADFEEVIKLCESALDKGLDETNTSFAKDVLISALWQHAEGLTAAIFDRPGVEPRWRIIRNLAMRDLDKIVKYNDKFPDAYMLRAKLLALPGGDAGQAMAAASKAVDLLEGDAPHQSTALVLRARIREDKEKQLEDLNRAIELDSSNTDAWRTRAAYHIQKGDLDKAVGDFEKMVENDPKNMGIRRALAETLLNLEKPEAALKQMDKVIELEPDAPMNYTLRAEILEAQKKVPEALEALDKALEIEPKDIIALLSRSRLRFLEDDLPAARADVEKVLEIRPGLTRGIILRSMISAAQGRIQEAIHDILMVLEVDRDNVELRLQLAALYVADERPRKAIRLLTNVLRNDKDNWMALRARADALLSVGKHAEAIVDYNTALKLQPNDDGILNNLAWVLATSPKEGLRDGQRAVQLATQACEVTKYEKPHILSTLAAAYAEEGDFETAKKWSAKAVELGRKQGEEQVEQLEQELESYKRGEKWRELQEIEEKPDPPRNIIET